MPQRRQTTAAERYERQRVRRARRAERDNPTGGLETQPGAPVAPTPEPQVSQVPTPEPQPVDIGLRPEPLPQGPIEELKPQPVDPYMTGGGYYGGGLPGGTWPMGRPMPAPGGSGGIEGPNPPGMSYGGGQRGTPFQQEWIKNNPGVDIGLMPMERPSGPVPPTPTGGFETRPETGGPAPANGGFGAGYPGNPASTIATPSPLPPAVGQRRPTDMSGPPGSMAAGKPMPSPPMNGGFGGGYPGGAPTPQPGGFGAGYPGNPASTMPGISTQPLPLGPATGGAEPQPGTMASSGALAPPSGSPPPGGYKPMPLGGTGAQGGSAPVDPTASGTQSADEPLPTVNTGEFQFTDSQNQMLEGFSAAQKENLRQRAIRQSRVADQNFDKGPSRGSNLEGGNAFWDREYRKATKQGKSHEEASAFANNQFGNNSRSKHGERTGDIRDFHKDRFGSDQWVANHIAKGLPGGNGGTGGTGGTGGGPGGEIGPSAPHGETAPFPHQGPIIEVGQDPLSEDITGALRGIMESGGGPTTGFGEDVNTELSRLLREGGMLDQDVVGQRQETAMEGLNAQEQQRISSLDARMAARGLSGGAHAGGLQEITRDIAGQQAGAFRNILADEQEQANQRYQQGLGISAGTAQNQVQNLLGATGQGTGRQEMLSRTALDALREDNDFNQFLAQYGLDRDQAMNDAQYKQLAAMMPLLQMMWGGSQISNQGYIPYER